MLKIQNNEFKIKFTEINIRQRMFENESFITLMINTEFFPALIDESVISGSIEFKLDLKEIKSIDELINNNEVKIGKYTLPVSRTRKKDFFKALMSYWEGGC